MRWLALIAFASAAVLATVAAAQTSDLAGLEGLWVAHARYGPDVRGTLIILQRGNGLVADIAGFIVPVKQKGTSLSFELPDGKGAFRGERIDGQVDGHWIQQRTVSGGAAHATPIVLRPDGRGRW